MALYPPHYCQGISRSKSDVAVPTPGIRSRASATDDVRARASARHRARAWSAYTYTRPTDRRRTLRDKPSSRTKPRVRNIFVRNPQKASRRFLERSIACESSRARANTHSVGIYIEYIYTHLFRRTHARGARRRGTEARAWSTHRGC